MTLVTGICASFGTSLGLNAERGGYKVQPPVENCQNTFIRRVNAMISIKPVERSIWFGNAWLNEFPSSLKK